MTYDFNSFSDSTRSPEPHPLRALFQEMVSEAFHETIGIPDQSVSLYLGDLLTEFARIDHAGFAGGITQDALRPLASLITEVEEEQNADLSPLKRGMHKQIGDFTLFWAGLYPENLRRLHSQGKAERLIQYVQRGKESYYIVSTYDSGRYAEDAALFRSLSDRFELYLYGLSLVRRQWERMAAHPA